MDEYLKEVEVCERLKLSRTSLWVLRKEGLPFRKIGGVFRYLPEEVEEWIATHCSMNEINRSHGPKELKSDE